VPRGPKGEELPRPITIPQVMTIKTLGDVRTEAYLTPV
jgi:hypothetical protein